METLFRKHRILISQVSMTIVRQMMHTVKWERQLVSIRGSRGVGKTTLMRQYIRQKYGINAGEALYLVMDSMYFTNHTLLEVAERFHLVGGKHLFLDEVHKYPTESKEVKEIIDLWPDLRITFTGSSLLQILNADAVLALSEYIKPVKNMDNAPIILLHIKYIYQNLDVLDVLLEEICRLKNYKTILVSDNRGSYYSHPQYDIVLERFNKKKINYEIIAYPGVENLIDLINKSTFVITTKLHVGITAAALNKRVFSIYKHPKTKRFHRQIGNIYCIPLSGDGKNYQELFGFFFESSTFSLSEELKQRALQNRRYLVSFLKSIKNKGRII